MDGVQKVAKLLEPKAAIAQKIGQNEASSPYVTQAILGKNCVCGESLVLCVVELQDNPGMIMNNSWHICLNSACSEKSFLERQTGNVGGGAAPECQDIYTCSLCGRKV